MKSRGKRQIQEENDVLLEIGKPGKEGIKNFVEVKKAEEKKLAEQEEHIVQEVSKRRRTKLEYNRFLSDVLRAELETLLIPIGWRINVDGDDVGVVMEVHNKMTGKIYRSAFGSTGDARLDLNAVHNHALKAENTLYRMKQDGILI